MGNPPKNQLDQKIKKKAMQYGTSNARFQFYEGVDGNGGDGRVDGRTQVKRNIFYTQTFWCVGNQKNEYGMP